MPAPRWPMEKRGALRRLRKARLEARLQRPVVHVGNEQRWTCTELDGGIHRLRERRAGE